MSESFSIEKSVVGFALLYPSGFNEAVQSEVTEDWFSEPECKRVWRLAEDLSREGYVPDAVLVNERVKRDGLRKELPASLLALLLRDAAFTSLSFGDYLRELRAQLAARMRGQLWAEGRVKQAESDAEGEQRTAEEIARTFIEAKPEVTIQSAAAEFAAELSKGVVPDHGLATGLVDLDRTLGTLQPGELILVAARPGGGKSSLTRQIATKVAMDARGVVMVSTEMGAREIAIAAARQQSGIAWKKGDRLPADMAAAFGEMVGRISTLSTLKLIEQRSLPAMIARWTAMMDDEFPPALFVVDYIQQIDADQQKGENLATALGRVSTALKAFALKHRVVVLAAAQLNRDSVKDGEPQLIHLRDSGSLEQDADRVLMMKLADEESVARYATMNVYQKKHRNGSTGEIRLVFDRWTTRFANYTG